MIVASREIATENHNLLRKHVEIRWINYYRNQNPDLFERLMINVVELINHQGMLDALIDDGLNNVLHPCDK